MRPPICLLWLLLWVAISPASSFSPPPSIPLSALKQSSLRSSTSKLESVPLPVCWATATSIGGCLGVPFVTSATRSGGWYTKITLPPFTPPDWLFGPVWTLLYASMGVAAQRVFARNPTSPALKIAAFHYLVNLSWSPFFFGTANLRPAHSLNFVMLGTLFFVGPNFYAIDRVAGLLLLPYLVWLSFATVLNAAICRLNPTKKGYNEAKFQRGLIILQEKARRSVGL